MLEISFNDGPSTDVMSSTIANGTRRSRLPNGSMLGSGHGRSTVCSRAPLAPRFGATPDDTPQRRPVTYSRDQPQPAQLLVLAILQRALDDLHLGGRFRLQAMAWLHEHQSEPQPGSFEWCCAALDLDAGAVRSKCGARAAFPPMNSRTGTDCR